MQQIGADSENYMVESSRVTQTPVLVHFKVMLFNLWFLHRYLNLVCLVLHSLGFSIGHTPGLN